MNKQNKFDSKMFHNKNQELYKTKSRPLHFHSLFYSHEEKEIFTRMKHFSVNDMHTIGIPLLILKFLKNLFFYESSSLHG